MSKAVSSGARKPARLTQAKVKLAAEIRAFVKQEINHTREHVAFNRLAE